ncbi:MAG: RDD family protein [Schleiferiaceae bacterium]|jgi:uncharacterized RDD family membrane protein YckC|nr:RDD family protein [Schleiferiaceae bacterium]
MENIALDNELYQKELNLVHASKGKRFANYLIDGVSAYLLLELVIFVLESLNLYFFGRYYLLDYLFNSFIIALYYIICESSMKGKTIGKFITKTRAVSSNGLYMDMSDIVKRSFSRVVPFEQFSFLGSEPTGWHDRWSNSMVIDENSSPDAINLN